jgi:hypothetical protein
VEARSAAEARLLRSFSRLNLLVDDSALCFGTELRAAMSLGPLLGTFAENRFERLGHLLVQPLALHINTDPLLTGRLAETSGWLNIDALRTKARFIGVDGLSLHLALEDGASWCRQLLRKRTVRSEQRGCESNKGLNPAHCFLLLISGAHEASARSARTHLCIRVEGRVRPHLK